MLTNLSKRPQLQDVVVHSAGLKGIHPFYKKQTTRAPEACCRQTMVGYTQIIISHDGTNPLFGERNAWVTHIAHKPRLEVCEHHIEGVAHVYLIRPDDLVTSLTLAQSEMCADGMEHPALGLWQIIAFHRPGTRGEMCLPRLLIPFDQIAPRAHLRLH